MRRTFEAVVLVTALSVGACHREGDPRASRSAASASGAAPSVEGCFELRSGAGPPTRIRLDSAHRGSLRAATDLDHASVRSQAWEQWSWARTDSANFYITWHGIDSALRIDVHRIGDAFEAAETIYTVGAPRESVANVVIVPIDCPTAAS